MGLIPEEKILEIKEVSNIVGTISDYVSLRKAGVNFKGLCPFHVEKTPSFLVSPAKQIFHCFGCGVGGNVFHFISKVENLNFIDAVKFLAEKNGIRLALAGVKEDIKEEIYKINELAAKFFKEKLLESKSVQDYLKRRNINNETINRFLLGFAPDAWDGFYNFARKNNISDYLLLQTGLVIKREKSEGYYDRFRNRLMFSIFNNSGKICGFGGRVLDDSLPKYINSPESPVYIKGRNLYGWHFAKESIVKENKAIIVEGYFDCITSHQFGITNVVATLGTALTKEQTQIVKRYADNAVIAYDIDLAGIKASLRGLDLLIEEGLNVKIAVLEEGKDPDEYLNKKGKHQFLSCLSKSKEIIDFWFDISKKEKLSDLKGKLKLVNEMLPVVAKVQDDGKRLEYRKLISEKLSIPETYISKELDKLLRKIYKIDINEKKSPKVLAIYELAERKLLKLVLGNSNIAKRVRNKITPSDFSNPVFAKLLEIVFSYLDENKETNNINISDFTDENLTKAYTELVFEKEEYKDEIKAENDLIRVIEENRMKKRLIELEEEVKNLGKKDVDKKLIEEYWQLQKYLKGNRNSKVVKHL
ncbi:MAG: DNA primase [Candidatus Firestonebacteria bacterium]